jgi:hypothetical protein
MIHGFVPVLFFSLTLFAASSLGHPVRWLATAGFFLHAGGVVAKRTSLGRSIDLSSAANRHSLTAQARLEIAYPSRSATRRRSIRRAGAASRWAGVEAQKEFAGARMCRTDGARQKAFLIANGAGFAPLCGRSSKGVAILQIVHFNSV